LIVLFEIKINLMGMQRTELPLSLPFVHASRTPFLPVV